jgi:hypothetical protein
MTHTTASITIRPAYADDHAALSRLAALDSADRVPAMPMVIAEVDGDLRAALSLLDGAAIADPFFPTAHLLALLRAHADGTTRTAGTRTRRRAPQLTFA